MQNPRCATPRAAGTALACVLSLALFGPRAEAAETCTRATPGAGDYCASDKCGVCYEGEGDCDPGQCGPGLTCVEEGAVDRCRVAECDASPGASDFCSPTQCGPCLEGEGDCDPGQCERGLECVEEGNVDRCRPSESACDAAPGTSNFCASYECGPCLSGEGDCDPGECAQGLQCREEGTVDRCRPVVSNCTAQPGSGSYCDPTQCGPCDVGEGDCDPGQCAAGTECVEEGAVDVCRPIINGTLEVKKSGVWRPVGCVNGLPQIVASNVRWKMVERKLTDNNAVKLLNCFEGGPQNCVCDNWGENMHGINGWEVGASLLRSEGGPMYPDHLMSTCVVLDSNNRLDTIYTNSSCPPFRLR